MKTLTLIELKDFIDTNHCIYLYPKKKTFAIDGSKKYIASKICINYYKEKLIK